MALIHELTDKLGELLETTQGQELSKAEAEIILQDLTHIDPDISKFLQRRFSRLALPLQQFVLQILDAAQAKHYASLLQAWSQEAALHLSLRLQALRVLEHLGEAIDHLYHDALIQANRVFVNLGEQADSQITETGELQETWRQAVVNLPINLAIDLGGQLSPDRPSVALAVFRALLTAVDAKDCQLLVQRVANIPQTESVQLLQHLLAETTEKSLQKTIKKALHRLRSQGLEIEGGAHRSHAAVVGTATHHLEKCLASHIDGDGNRVLWMIRTKPFGGYNIAYLVINYGTGIQVAFGLQASKRELPTLLAQAQDQVRLIELDSEYCQYQIAVAHQMNLDTRTPVPEKFFGLQDIIGKAPTTFEKALIYSVLSEADLQEAQADSGHADDLLEIAEFAGWTLPLSIVQQYADRIREVEDAQIVVSPALQRERIRDLYTQASQEVLGEDSRRVMRIRLEEMAHYLLQTERRREALWAVAVAQTLQAQPTAGQSNPFIEALLQRSLDRAKEHPGSRIIQPFSQPSERSESRLII